MAATPPQATAGQVELGETNLRAPRPRIEPQRLDIGTGYAGG